MRVNILKLARFIEHYGNVAVVIIVAATLLVSAGVFYFYGWRAVSLVAEPTFQVVELNQDKLEKVLSDLKDRQIKSQQGELPPVSNIFR